MAPVRSRASLTVGLVLLGLGVTTLVGVAGRMWLHSPATTRPAESAAVDGCTVSTSPGGYPDWYIAHAQTYGAHPPAPASGWRGPSEHVGFNVLFHALFHGYTVVQYRAGISPETRETLRKWVLLHAGESVTAAPAPSDAPVAIDVARWGHELSCTDAASLTVRRLDQLLSP